MMNKVFLTTIALLLAGIAQAQFAPQTPLPGSGAVAADDPRIIAWASDCSLQRGWLDIADKSLGQPELGDATAATGAYDLSLVSLGDSGVAVLTFEDAIRNGDGPDFVVFENGFANPLNPAEAYLELAFVEVSSDGEHFVRFPAISHIQDTVQVDNFTYTDASLLRNLAGTYIAGYGTPFDLEDLADSAGIDLNRITHIRIVDVIGTVDPAHASFDSEGHIINEAYPTPYPSGGFDLNAVGVINNTAAISIEPLWAGRFHYYPNPAQDMLYLEADGHSAYTYYMSDITGRTLLLQGNMKDHAAIDISALTTGVYLLHVSSGSRSMTYKISKM